ncbi:MAG: hypothetical protein KBA33_02295 [Cloacibacterium sp.]|nr:hypothetical protein [Cloacibacterium sp.]
MENTFTIEVNNIKAFDLLKKLEELNLIKFLKKEKNKQAKLSEKLITNISKEQGKELDTHVKNLREEW